MIESLNTLLAVKNVTAFLLQLFPETRALDPLARQVVTVPAGYAALIAYFAPYSPHFGQLIREEWRDHLGAYAASTVIDNLASPEDKLNAWAEYLTYGKVSTR